ncbi:hypothetical protein L1987_35406 [Smallanthus sonchifolius]|uniref:Uncharacterized protein n=1 Tax=Smallanthus sonchifolius TaxID=185202 RepID=A0ACB9HXC0_9ASTR|nr:hypothetical protein L1987_35406 [Smallanthus sonchifolius]
MLLLHQGDRLPPHPSTVGNLIFLSLYHLLSTVESSPFDFTSPASDRSGGAVNGRQTVAVVSGERDMKSAAIHEGDDGIGFPHFFLGFWSRACNFGILASLRLTYLIVKLNYRKVIDSFVVESTPIYAKSFKN